MSILRSQQRERALHWLLPQLDNRRGSALFIGADLPEIATQVLGQGMFVTVVETDADRMDAFMAPLREQRIDKSVTWERRPFNHIEFQSSSFTYASAWNGVPDGFEDQSLFFKKIRRELKAGGMLYLKSTVRRNLFEAFPELDKMLGHLPGGVRNQVQKIAETWTGLIPEIAAESQSALETRADRYLDLQEALPLSTINHQLVTHLSRDIRGSFSVLPGQLFKLADQLDARLSAMAAAQLFPTTTFFKFSRTKELGRVFILS